MQRFLCFMFSLIFSKWLEDDWKVEKVIGWRSARLVSKYGGKKCITPIFWWFD